MFGGWKPRAVVFDCDGLLMDTEPCWTVAETTLFARHGLPFGPEQKALLIGKALPAAGEAMAVAFDRPGAGPALAAELYALVTVVVADRAEPMPGAYALVERVAAAVPVAVASNSPRALLDVALARGDFSFPVSVAADEVAHPKPAPDLYRESCERLGVRPTDTLAFEDSMTGLRAARAAGLPVVGVPTLPDSVFPADLVVDSLLDPDLLAWLDGWR
jgi:HAD superfamily hydrolase (TIGR01509 family)